MKSIIAIIYVLLNSFFVSCSFQTSFFQEINKQYINKNLLISPLSAYQVLGLTANGAKGETLNQMLLALGNTDLDELNEINKNILNIFKEFTTIEIANAVMTKVNPKETFLDAAELYEATVEPLKNVAQVNNWCNLKTHGKIKEIIDELEEGTLMVLLNALYFKGTWKIEFDERNTTKQIFYNYNKQSNSKKVDKMKVKEKFNYYEDREAQIIELPYKSDGMSAIIILPNEEKDINEYISELSDEKLQRLLKRMYEETVTLEIPKFKIEFSSLLNSVLQKLGMVIPFGVNADFSGIIDEGLYISKVIQKTYLSIDEIGTEAAAVTAVVMRNSIDLSMVIDRPFLFMLRNKHLPQNYEMLFISKIEEL